MRRQWRLLFLLWQGEGYTVEELAAHMGVAQKTIRRDLDVLREAGIKLREKRESHGRKRYSVELAGATRVGLAPTEALAIWVAVQLLVPYAGTVWYKTLRQLADEWLNGLPDSTQRYIRRTVHAIYATGFGAPADGERWALVLERIVQALEQRRILRVTYQSLQRSGPRTYMLHPYALVVHRHSLYLVAYSEQHRDVRHFKLNRVLDAVLLSSIADIPSDFDVEEHLRGAFGVFNASGKPVRVRIRFAPSVARYVAESCWHSTQKLDWTPAGGVILEMTLSDTTEVKSWVMSFGSNAEVLEPAQLRDEVATELARALTRYRPATRGRKARTTRGDVKVTDSSIAQETVGLPYSGEVSQIRA